MIIPPIFQPQINTVYPFENFYEFERWFGDNYKLNLDREYLGVFWCAYQVNHNYGNDTVAMSKLQKFIDELPRYKKYFTISQYDDGCGVDFKDLDVIIFDMSKESKYQIPLLCQPHSYKWDGDKNLLASFIGTHTHPIRDWVFQINHRDIYVSDRPHNVNEFCTILADSYFGLCPRGYGKSSFRLYECLQYQTIPVYISDEFIFPYDLNFEEFGLIIRENEVDRIVGILENISPLEIIKKQEKIKELYETHFTYKGCFNQIVKTLTNENINNS